MRARRMVALSLGILTLAFAGIVSAGSSVGASGSPGTPVLAQATTEGSAPGYAGERPAEMEQRIQRSRFHYLMLGYGVIWVCLGVYMFGLHRKVAAVGREIGELRSRLEEAEAPSSRR